MFKDITWDEVKNLKLQKGDILFITDFAGVRLTYLVLFKQNHHVYLLFNVSYVKSKFSPENVPPPSGTKIARIHMRKLVGIIFFEDDNITLLRQQFNEIALIAR